MWSLGAGLGEASCGELARALEAITAELASRPAPESDLAAVEVAESVGRSVDRCEAALATLVGRVDVTGAHGELGFPSTVSWLRERLGMRHGRAAERVMLSRQLPRLERVRERLYEGELSLGFASAICSSTTRLDESDAMVAEDILLGMVRDGCGVGQVAKAGDTITDLVGERLGRDKEPEDAKRGFARSWMSRSKSLDGGSWFKGWFTPEHSAAFDEIVGTLAKPKARGDDRDISQRTADALFSVLTEGNRGAGVTVIIDLAAYTEATGDPGPFTHQPRPHDSTAANDAASEDAARAGAARSRAARESAASYVEAPDRAASYGGDFFGTAQSASSEGATSDDVSSENASPENASPEEGNPEEAEADAGSTRGSPIPRPRTRPPTGGKSRPAARLLDGTPITPQDARRIALNAGINALILGRDHIPIYLGRTTRFATPTQRKTLLALHDTCAVVGCQIPAHLCEIHHLGCGWKLGAPTDIDQLTVLCGWHNRWIETHEDQVIQTKDAQGRTTLKILPPWTSTQTTHLNQGPAGIRPAA